MLVGGESPQPVRLSKDARRIMKPSTLQRRSALALAGALMASGVALGAAPAASAYESPRTNGCFAYWGGKNSSAHCRPATRTGYFKLRTACAKQPDKVSNSVYIRQGAYTDGWATHRCLVAAQSAYISFNG